MILARAVALLMPRVAHTSINHLKNHLPHGAIARNTISVGLKFADILQ